MLHTRHQTEDHTEDEDHTTIIMVVAVAVFLIDLVACQLVTAGIVKMAT